VERLEALNLAGVECDSNYQLNVEDACDLAGSRAAVFIDASMDGPEPFSFERIAPSEEIRFTHIPNRPTRFWRCAWRFTERKSRHT
jgi:hypothetical protein